MSWLEAVFQRTKPIAADHPEGAYDAITFEGGRPGWATGTGLYRTVDQPLTNVPERAVIAMTAVESTKPLPKRHEAGRR